MESTTENSKTKIPFHPDGDNVVASEEGKEEKQKKFKLEKGAEALLRVTLRNHMDLSDMADRKAGLLITISTLVMSVIGSSLFTKLDKNLTWIAPTMILVASCLAVMILAIVSTRPKVSKGKFTNKQVQNKAVNLLFFGNFFEMSLRDFQWATDEMLHDREYMFDAITQDIHALGKVVARKYKYLHLAYNVFMYGLVTSVVAFGVSFLFANKVL